jgi:transposase
VRAWRLAAMLTAMRLTLEDVCGALMDYRPPSEIGRHELTNEQWLLIRELFPKPETRRGSPRHPRRLLDGMFWTLRAGAPWRDLPRERYGSWRTVWRRFDPWRREGRLDLVKQRLLARLNEAGELDWDLWCVDGTSIRAARCASGGGKRGAPRNRRTTRSDVHAAVGEPRFTWSPTVKASP